ncbi:MAG: Stage II sporulation protein P (SpoIIP) [Firmicutes bacterium ADurb.Bin300]|nr:MAG: Stage II sporulation protein P (SpoIIP) [Firmicutes bacterium ADurb.Bin300]
MKSITRFSAMLFCAVACILIFVSVWSGKADIGTILSPLALAVVGVNSPLEYADAVINELYTEEEAQRVKQTSAVLNLLGFGAGTQQINSLAYVSKDISDMIADSESMYASLKKTEDIVREDLSSRKANTVFKSVSVNDSVSEQNVDIAAKLGEKLDLSGFDKTKPCILIYHTHATEGFEIIDMGWYSDGYNSRTKDTSRNIVRVGEEIARMLTDKGFTVIHDKTIHDSTYSGSYDRSAKTVKKWLAEYPSIILSLDVHRDAIHYDGKIKSKPTCVIDNKNAAQIMIISGCESGSVTDFPNWRDNLTFSCKLQEKVEELYPGLMRPIFFCERKYNMDMTRYSMLLEIGTDANTLDEAVYSGRLIGNALAKFLEEQTD